MEHPPRGKRQPFWLVLSDSEPHLATLRRDVSRSEIRNEGGKEASVMGERGGLGQPEPLTQQPGSDRPTATAFRLIRLKHSRLRGFERREQQPEITKTNKQRERN